MLFVTYILSSVFPTLHVYTPESDLVSCPSDRVLSVLKLVPFFFYLYVQLWTHSAVHVMSCKTFPSLTTCVEPLGVTDTVSGPPTHMVNKARTVDICGVLLLIFIYMCILFPTFGFKYISNLHYLVKTPTELEYHSANLGKLTLLSFNKIE